MLKLFATYTKNIFKLRFWIWLSVVVVVSSESYAQGTLIEHSEPSIKILQEEYLKISQKQSGINGYRIHITSTNNRTEVNQLKGKLYQLYPEMKPFITYQAPNFKLRVGNFLYKIDAYKALQQLIPEFPGAFIVNEELKPDDF